MLENAMVVGADEEWERIWSADFWEDHTCDLVMEFADDELALDAMKYWLMCDDCSDDRLYELFEALSLTRQYEIIEEYIDCTERLRIRYNEWCKARYEDAYLDYKLEEEYARDMGAM